MDPFLSFCTKCKCKWIKDFSIKPVTLNLIEQNMRNTLEHLGTGDSSMSKSSIAQTPRMTTNKVKPHEPEKPL